VSSKLGYLRSIAIGLASGAVVLALLIFGLNAGGAGGSNVAANPAPTTPDNGSTPSVSPSSSPSASDGRTCSVAKLITDKRLGNFQAIVANPATDEVLFDRGGETPAATASVLKLITAAAALQTLGPNYVISTNVYQDATDPGVIYLRGAGDPTLSRTRAGVQTVYKDAPKLSDLAIQVNQALAGQKVTKIVLDASLFTGPTWQPSWDGAERTMGSTPLITALEADGDRANPGAETSPRSLTPIENVGAWFKRALGATARGAKVQQAVTPNDATQIATVHSQPVSTLVKHMLLVSDNTEAEYLARQVAIKLGYSGSFTSIDIALKKSLATTGLDFSNVTLIDGSGLSDNNRVAPVFFTQLMKLVLNSYGDFAIIGQGLPVSHESGSLASRFGGANLDAAGKIQAKTGWIKHGYTLAGIIHAKDGTELTFAVYALGNVQDNAKDAIDKVVTGFYRCGNKLSNQ
jgi:D-alanyl-D-alanine carboxypeptidase/D-alanyl-D-alanine-endopeptidase (penicillin-binding protein 4)